VSRRDHLESRGDLLKVDVAPGVVLRVNRNDRQPRAGVRGKQLGIMPLFQNLTSGPRVGEIFIGMLVGDGKRHRHGAHGQAQLTQKAQVLSRGRSFMSSF